MLAFSVIEPFGGKKVRLGNYLVNKNLNFESFVDNHRIMPYL